MATKKKKAVKKKAGMGKARMIAQKELAKAKKRFAAAEKKVRGYIKKNPEKAALIAAAAGAAIGAAIGAGITKAMRRRKKE